ncbi:MAG TPA: hypothetical protein DDY91_24510 [Planctomycetaceae bacterium]|nr:hypothetical protein [Planctomycetaceae bacterium]
MGRLLCACLWLLVGLLLPARSARGELKPEQVGVIANARGRESAELARHYMQARGIPAENLLLLEVATNPSISRQIWDSKLRPTIRKWLQQEGREQRIRCLVTLWDIPLKIGPLEPNSTRGAEVGNALQTARGTLLGRLQKTLQGFNTLLDPEAKALDPLPDKADADTLAKALNAPFQKALKNVQQLAAKSPGTLALKRAELQIDQDYTLALGIAGSLQVLEAQLQQKSAPEAMLRQRIEQKRAEFAGLGVGLQTLQQLPESVERDEMIISLRIRMEGLLGAYNWVNQQAELWKKNETLASFDSELSLVLWSNHPLLRWIPNPLNHTQGLVGRTLPPTLIVARLDGPSLTIAKRLVDDAVAVEKEGLTGKIYIDARGIKDNKGPGSYGDYDQSLRELAGLLREKSALPVTFDDRQELFQPGECPDTALYCGWYSLAKYVPAFEWRRGSVGYHIASSEATTLRDSKSEVWCKRMLEEGVAVTLGPTFEPYLVAFPRPSEFFPLLMTGRLCLGEVYALTVPLQSWAITLVGDPLYNPFRNKPALQVEDLPAPLQLLIPTDP